MYSRESNARKLERQPELQKVIQGKAKKEKPQGMTLILVMITVFAFAVLFRYAQINVLTNQLKEAKDTLSEAQRAVASLEIAAEQGVDLKRVEEIATNELGMKRPEKSQIVYINVIQNDNAQVIKKSAKQINVARSITKGLGNVFAYLF